MKAIILAAGRGERMRPLTDDTPKPLLKVAGKTLISYHIERLVAAGIDDIVINTAWLKQTFPQALGDGSDFNCRIRYSEEPVGQYETAGGIKQALNLLGQEPFIVVNGDIWTNYDFNQLKRPLADNSLAHLVLVNNPAHHQQGDFAIAADGKLLSQSTNEQTKWTYSGIGLYTAELFAQLKQYPAPLGPLLRAAMQTRQISGEHYQGEWSDIGTPARLAQLAEQLSIGEDH